MTIRRRGRQLALQALYQIEVTGDTSTAALEFFLHHFEGSAGAKDFARRLITGVVTHHKEIDRLISQSADNWKLSRMAKVDLTIMRMATYEMLFCPDIPMSVSMNEAIEIAKRYGSGDSAIFINGVLDQVAEVSGVK
jgi:N utilization substance protein B